MRTQFFLGLLMLLEIFFQGSDSLSERNIATAHWVFNLDYKFPQKLFFFNTHNVSYIYVDTSPDRHVRQKRVIDTCHDRNENLLHQPIPYVVLFIKKNGDFHCTGTILKARIILTAAHCVFKEKFLIVTRGRLANNIKINNVVTQYIHEGFDSHSRKNDLALVIIDKPIDLDNYFHRSIELYEGRITKNSHGLFTGWGWTTRSSPKFPSQPLSILVPIISLQQCQHFYHNQAIITSHEICTYYTNRTKTCWFGDSGGPLVVNGHLVGLLSWFRSTDELEFPDIFMNLMDSGYKMWVEAWVNHFHNRYDS